MFRVHTSIIRSIRCWVQHMVLCTPPWTPATLTPPTTRCSQTCSPYTNRRVRYSMDLTDKHLYNTVYSHYTHTHTHTHIHTHAHTHTHTRTHTYTHTYTHTHTHTRTHTLTNTHAHHERTRTHTTHTHTHARARTYAHARARAHTHTHTHTSYYIILYSAQNHMLQLNI